MVIKQNETRVLGSRWYDVSCGVTAGKRMIGQHPAVLHFSFFFSFSLFFFFQKYRTF